MVKHQKKIYILGTSSDILRNGYFCGYGQRGEKCEWETRSLAEKKKWMCILYCWHVHIGMHTRNMHSFIHLIILTFKINSGFKNKKIWDTVNSHKKIWADEDIGNTTIVIIKIIVKSMYSYLCIEVRMACIHIHTCTGLHVIMQLYVRIIWN